MNFLYELIWLIMTLLSGRLSDPTADQKKFSSSTASGPPSPLGKVTGGSFALRPIGNFLKKVPKPSKTLKNKRYSSTTAKTVVDFFFSQSYFQKNYRIRPYQSAQRFTSKKEGLIAMSKKCIIIVVYQGKKAALSALVCCKVLGTS